MPRGRTLPDGYSRGVPHPCPSPRARARRAGGVVAALAACAAVLPVAAPGPAAAAHHGAAPTSAVAVAAPADPDQALRVRLDTLAPAVLPRRGPVQMTGSVTNTTGDTWTDVRLYAISSAEPITTRAALGEAAATDPAAEVGRRTTEEGTFDTVAELAPGQTARWSVRVPRRLLDVPAGVPGVYWLGVHALGSSGDGRDGFADGRARTFVASVPPRTAPVPVSLVLPVRRPVRHEPDGSLAQVERWVRDLGPGGPLRSMIDLGASAGDRDVTWLLDPAVLVAVQRLAAGNPGRSLAPTLPPGAEEAGGGGEDGTPSPTGEPSGAGATDPAAPSGAATDASPGPGGDATDGDGIVTPQPPSALELEAAGLARTWLARATVLLGEGAVLSLPYADLDVAAAAHRAPDLLGRATALSAATTAALKVGGVPAAAPPDGRLDGAALTALPDDAVVLLAPAALPDPAEPVVEVGGRRVLTTDPAATAGGPGPDAPLSSVAVRQRLLAEAALTALAARRTPRDGADPLVTLLPEQWNPADGLGFFTGLDDAPWLRLQTVATSAAVGAPRVEPGALRYDAEAARAEVGTPLLSATTEALRTGALLESVLTRNDQVATVVARETLGGASYAARRTPRAWRRLVTSVRTDLETTLGQVRVEAPEGTVTLSSEVGGFPAALVNDLDQPVTVRIEGRTTSPVTLEAPAEIELQPGERTSVVLRARTRQIGLHEVRLLVTSTDGTPLGSTDEVKIRSAQVSWIIWVVVAAGGTLLFGAIGVRLLRRVRAARRDTAPATTRPGKAST